MLVASEPDAVNFSLKSTTMSVTLDRSSLPHGVEVFKHVHSDVRFQNPPNSLIVVRATWNERSL